MNEEPDPFYAGDCELHIDLRALADNYLYLKSVADTAVCAAVVKADAYGLGVREVVPALRRAGCRLFFVATLAEGVTLRDILPDVEIYVLNGLLAGQATIFTEFQLTPILNDPGQIEQWAAHCRHENAQFPASIQFDTGMNRLGLSATETDHLLENPSQLDAMRVTCWMSHLACASQSEHSMNTEQLERFQALLERLPPTPASLANSAGILLGEDYHFDIVRPGLALYGGNPWDKPAPLLPVVHLLAPVLQVRDVAPGETLGYDATHRATQPMRVATIAAGYADGFGNMFSNCGQAMIDGKSAPFVGRVSMDSILLDVTHLPVAEVFPGSRVELLGTHCTINDCANVGGILSYEVLTNLSTRYRRIYHEEAFPHV